jgi:hypothetical protein
LRAETPVGYLNEPSMETEALAYFSRMLLVSTVRLRFFD